MDDTFYIGVITVTYNSEKFIEDFLRCCEKQRFCAYKLLVIDNNSTDQTANILDAYNNYFKFSIIRNNVNIGYAAACNQGIKYFKQLNIENLVFINNDTEFDDNLIGDLFKSKKINMADAITPKIVYANNPKLVWHGGGKLQYWKGAQGRHLKSEIKHKNQIPRRVEMSTGCCVIFSSSIFEDLGEFDPLFFVYYEDTDFFYRMKIANKKLIYDPNIILKHKVSLSTGGSQSNFSIYHFQKNQIIFIRKHLNNFYIVIQFFIIYIKIILRFIFLKDGVSKFLLRLKAVSDGRNILIHKKNNA